MCWKCGNDISTGGFVTRDAECVFCHADLHSCRNCTFYSLQSHYECRETISEYVKDKERSNFCEYFKLNRFWANNAFLAVEKAKNARKAVEALFS